MNEEKVRANMQKALDEFTTDISSLRTGRPAASLVQLISVPAYGGVQKLTIQELANINVQDNSITIEPWDASIIGDIKKGIEIANIGLNPQIDAEVIRLTFPPLTGEDRLRLVKILNSKLEASRITIRQLRGEAMKEIKQNFENKHLSEDEKNLEEEKIQEITDEFIKRSEAFAQSKQNELTNI